MCTQALQRSRPDLEHRPVRAVDRDPEPVQRRAEPLADERHVAVRVLTLFLRCRRLTAGIARAFEERFDRLLLVVLQLPTPPKELHAVVLAWVVRRRDDRAGLVGEKGD